MIKQIFGIVSVILLTIALILSIIWLINDISHRREMHELLNQKDKNYILKMIDNIYKKESLMFNLERDLTLKQVKKYLE